MSTPKHLLKFSRAHDKLRDLDKVVAGILNPNYERAVIETDANDVKHLILKASADAVPADPVSLVVGEIIQSLRSGLDHIAFQLAAKHTNPLPDNIAEDSQFPIIGDKNRKGVSGSGPAMFINQTKCLAGV